MIFRISERVNAPAQIALIGRSTRKGYNEGNRYT